MIFRRYTDYAVSDRTFEVLRMAGFEIGIREQEPKPYNNPRSPNPNITQAVEEYLKHGTSVKVLAFKYRCTPNAIYNRVDRMRAKGAL